MNHGETVRDIGVADARMLRMAKPQPIQMLPGDPSRTQIPLVTPNAIAHERDAVAEFLIGTDAYAFESVNIQDFIETINQYARLSVEECRQRTSWHVKDVSLHVRQFT